MDFKFVLLIIYINIKGQTQLEVNWTQIDQFNLKKTQNGHFSKRHYSRVSIAKIPTPTFFIEFIWNFRNQYISILYGFRK